jgi:hypothetical protein
MVRFPFSYNGNLHDISFFTNVFKKNNNTPCKYIMTKKLWKNIRKKLIAPLLNLQTIMILAHSLLEIVMHIEFNIYKFITTQIYI